jgi:formate/nitrite transporter
MSSLNCNYVDMMSSPHKTYDTTVDVAFQKAHLGSLKGLVLGVMAGTYVGIGVSVCMLVGGGLSDQFKHDQPGVFSLVYSLFGFPTALTLIVVTGADLFTSACCYATVGLLERRITAAQAATMMARSYVGNLVGALAAMGLFTASQVFANRDNFLVDLAQQKVDYNWAVCLAKGVLCNWFVNLAVWAANAAYDLTGKFIGILLPISAFLVLGGEHCIANMFLIPTAMVQGAEIGIGKFVGRNLVPATLGNVVGGVGTACLFFFVSRHASM